MQEHVERYYAAAHAMQSGVAQEQALGSDCGSPKHLRVGVNSAMVDVSALATLLMSKGIITADEYHQALCDAMEKEQRRYEEVLTKRMGIPVTLG